LPTSEGNRWGVDGTANGNALIYRKATRRSGTIVDGQLYQPRKLEPAINEIDGSCLPTPTATNYGTNQTNSPNSKVRPSLQTLAKNHLIPTPTVCGNYNRKGASKNSGDGLATWASKLPTPMARDWKRKGGAMRNSLDLPGTMGGSLNPEFVEEIMGYPIGWTESKPWGIPWFRSKRAKRS